MEIEELTKWNQYVGPCVGGGELPQHLWGVMNYLNLTEAFNFVRAFERRDAAFRKAFPVLIDRLYFTFGRGHAFRNLEDYERVEAHLHFEREGERLETDVYRLFNLVGRLSRVTIGPDCGEFYPVLRVGTASFWCRHAELDIAAARVITYDNMGVETIHEFGSAHFVARSALAAIGRHMPGAASHGWARLVDEGVYCGDVPKAFKISRIVGPPVRERDSALSRATLPVWDVPTLFVFRYDFLRRLPDNFGRYVFVNYFCTTSRNGVSPFYYAATNTYNLKRKPPCYSLRSRGGQALWAESTTVPHNHSDHNVYVNTPMLESLAPPWRDTSLGRALTGFGVETTAEMVHYLSREVLRALDCSLSLSPEAVGCMARYGHGGVLKAVYLKKTAQTLKAEFRSGLQVGYNVAWHSGPTAFNAADLEDTSLFGEYVQMVSDWTAEGYGEKFIHCRYPLFPALDTPLRDICRVLLDDHLSDYLALTIAEGVTVSPKVKVVNPLYLLHRTLAYTATTMSQIRATNAMEVYRGSRGPRTIPVCTPFVSPVTGVEQGLFEQVYDAVSCSYPGCIDELMRLINWEIVAHLMCEETKGASCCRHAFAVLKDEDGHGTVFVCYANPNVGARDYDRYGVPPCPVAPEDLRPFYDVGGHFAPKKLRGGRAGWPGVRGGGD